MTPTSEQIPNPIKIQSTGRTFGRWKETRPGPPGHAQGHAGHAAHLTEDNGLQDELRHDASLLCAHGAAHADFTRPFRHRNEHDVHDADARGHEGDGTDQRNRKPNFESEGLELLDLGIVGEDFKIIRFAGRDFAQLAHDAAHFIFRVVKVRQTARLDQDAQGEPVFVFITIDSGGDGDDGEFVLASAFHRANGFEHADHGVL